jgi:hypothetical protein
MDEKRNAYKILVGKREGKDRLKNSGFDGRSVVCVCVCVVQNRVG